MSAHETVVSRPIPARRWLGRLGAGFLGVVLLVAALAKALDVRSFAEQIHALGPDGWVGRPAAGTLAYLVLGVEVALGLFLLTGVRRNFVLVPAVALVALFLFLTGRDAWRDARGLLPADAACGCFGNLVERTPAEAFAQDLMMLVPALLLSFLGREPRGRELPLGRVAIAVAGTAGALLFALKAPGLPLDDFATRLKPGKSIGAICAGRDAERVCLGTVVPELSTGEHLVVLADLADSQTGVLAPRLSAYAQSEPVASGVAPRLWMITAATPEQAHAFYWTHGPTFEIRAAPLALLRPLARTLPRAFRVRDGRVAETWSGWTHLETLISPAAGRS